MSYSSIEVSQDLVELLYLRLFGEPHIGLEKRSEQLSQNAVSLRHILKCILPSGIGFGSVAMLLRR